MTVSQYQGNWMITRNTMIHCALATIYNYTAVDDIENDDDDSGYFFAIMAK